MDSPYSSQPTGRTSVHSDFPRDSTTDLVIRSSDNILFHLHKKNLETHTGAFPGADLPLPIADQSNEGDVTHLTELGKVLAIVFVFVYPRKQPDLSDMDFDTVMAIAEAVEKYEVFSAMRLCEFRLRDFVKTHPQQLLVHALKHDYPSLVNAVVPYFARKPLNEIDEVLPDNLFRAWCRYHEKWERVFRMAMEEINERRMTYQEVARVLAWQAIPDLIQLQDALKSDDDLKCSYCSGTQMYCSNCHNSSTFGQSNFSCNQNLRALAELCRKEIAAIPPFTSFLK